MKKILSILLLLCSISYSQYLGDGTGTYADPYQIWTVAQLDSVKNDIVRFPNIGGNYFKIMADLDLSAYPHWTPIGINGSGSWDNSIDGNHHTIKNMKLTSSDVTLNKGFVRSWGTPSSVTPPVGKVNYGCKNLTFDGVYVNASIINAVNNNANFGILTNYINSGSVPGGLYFFDSVVVKNINMDLSYTSSVFDLHFSLCGNANTFVKYFRCGIEGNIKITVPISIGKIYTSAFGQPYGLNQCYAKINIETVVTNTFTNTYSGGLISYLTNSTDSVFNCYFKGYIKSEAYVGGLAGRSWGGAIFDDPYTANNYVAFDSLITYHGQDTTWLVSHGNNQPFYFYDTFADAETMPRGFPIKSISGAGQDTSTIRKTTLEMKTESTYTNWDFTNVWKISPNSNDGYPSLIWENLSGTAPLPLVIRGVYLR